MSILLNHWVLLELLPGILVRGYVHEQKCLKNSCISTAYPSMSDSLWKPGIWSTLHSLWQLICLKSILSRWFSCSEPLQSVQWIYVASRKFSWSSERLLFLIGRLLCIFACWYFFQSLSLSESEFQQSLLCITFGDGGRSVSGTFWHYLFCIVYLLS